MIHDPETLCSISSTPFLVHLVRQSLALEATRTVSQMVTQMVVEYTVKKYLHDIFYYVFNYIVNVVGTRN